MNAGTLATGANTSSFFAGWQPVGAWSGTFSGMWINTTNNQGSQGIFRSSTGYGGGGGSNASSYLSFSSSSLSITGGFNFNNYGYGVRCVMQ
jgi:hypothetical protein